MGPLAELKTVEFAGVGPAPMCAMLMADLGATVLRIERASPVELGLKRPAEFDLLNRGRTVIALDLKAKDGVAIALEIAERADALIEGYCPGVMERLGLGPEVCLAKNPRMVYGRMTGWGQDGPLADAAGHDLISIPYKGPAEAATDLIAGRLTVMPDSLGAATRNIRAGRTKALAVLSSARTPLLPEVPTMLGLGYKDFEFNGWIGILAPAGTPEAIVQRLSQEIVRAVAADDVNQQFSNVALDAVAITPKEYSEMLAREIAEYVKTAKDAGIEKQ